LIRFPLGACGNDIWGFDKIITYLSLLEARRFSNKALRAKRTQRGLRKWRCPLKRAANKSKNKG